MKFKVNNKKKSKGFTLVETILVIGIISLSMIALYSNYKQQTIKETASRQASYIEQLIKSITMIQIGSTTGTANLATEIARISSTTTNANLINSGIVPPEMINGANIVNVWGGTTSITGVSVGGTPGLQIFMNNVPTESCSTFITENKLVENTQSITVNGTLVKSIGSPFVNGTVYAPCTSTANTIVLTADLMHPPKYDGLNSGSAAPTGPNYLRGHEGRYNIAPAGLYTGSTAPGCFGGAYFDWTIRSCVCPGTSQWTGNACMAENNNSNGSAGLCALGYGWNPGTANCQRLPNAAPKWISNPWMGSVYSNIPNTLANRYGTRMIPNHIGVNPYVTGLDGMNSATCGSIPGGRWDGVMCQVCVRGTWQTDRCVTP